MGTEQKQKMSAEREFLYDVFENGADAVKRLTGEDAIAIDSAIVQIDNNQDYLNKVVFDLAGLYAIVWTENFILYFEDVYKSSKDGNVTSVTIIPKSMTPALT